jgi:hypothetical protein
MQTNEQIPMSQAVKWLKNYDGCNFFLKQSKLKLDRNLPLSIKEISCIKKCLIYLRENKNEDGLNNIIDND